MWVFFIIWFIRKLNKILMVFPHPQNEQVVFDTKCILWELYEMNLCVISNNNKNITLHFTYAKCWLFFLEWLHPLFTLWVAVLDVLLKDFLTLTLLNIPWLTETLQFRFLVHLLLHNLQDCHQRRQDVRLVSNPKHQQCMNTRYKRI